MKQWNIRVTGKVQGVSYRACAKAVADQLRVKGFVMNTPDGGVYMEATGDDFALDAFKEWCWEGSDAAVVDQVEIEEVTPKVYRNFEVVKKHR